jgi:hypothetical protein
MFIEVDSLKLSSLHQEQNIDRPNIALLTECRFLRDSSAINMSLLRSEELEETISHLPQPSPRGYKHVTPAE